MYLSFTCFRDAVMIALANCMTSVFIGMVIFSVLGFLANEMGVEIKDVAASGSGLAFVVYPAALSIMPVPQLWSVLFFVMLLTLGFGSQVGLFFFPSYPLPPFFFLFSNCSFSFLKMFCLSSYFLRFCSFLTNLVHSSIDIIDKHSTLCGQLNIIRQLIS